VSALNAATVSRAEFAALDTRERQHHIALTQYVGDSRAEFAALRDLALALAEPASGQTVRALAQKLKEAR
jgi:hypothetical protein